MKYSTNDNDHIRSVKPLVFTKKILSYLLNQLYAFRVKLSMLFFNTSLFLIGVLIHPQFFAYIYCFLISFSLKTSKRDKTICLAWDYKTCNCKYGDYIFALTSAKLIAILGYRVIFAEIYSNDNTKDLEYEKDEINNLEIKRNKFSSRKLDSLMIKFIDERKNIRRVFGDYSNLHFWEGDFRQFQRDFSHSLTKVLLRRRILERKYVINFYHNMISPLYCSLNFMGRDEFLKSLYSSSFTEQSDLVLSTNYRFNPSRPDKNSNIDLFSDLIASIGPSNKIYVATDDLGLKSLQDSIEWNHYLSKIKFSQIDKKYLNDFFEILQSKLYAQFCGGGMGPSIMVMTSQPYIYLGLQDI